MSTSSLNTGSLTTGSLDRGSLNEATSTVAGWAGHARGSIAYRRLLLGLFFAGIATFAQLYSPQALLPLIARQLRISADQSALVISFATIGLALGVIPWSAVADRIGRVKAMSIAVVAATVIGLAVPFAPSFDVILAGRFVEGLMIGGVPAIAIAYLTEEVAARHAARAAGTYIAGTTIGGLLGRLIAGPIGEVAGWRLGVVAVSVLCAACAVSFIILVPKPRGFVPQRVRGQDPSGSLRHRLEVNLRSTRQLALYAQGFLLMGGFVALYNYLGFRLAAAPFDLPQTLVSLIFIAYLAGTWSSAQAGALAGRHRRLPVLLTSIAVMVIGVLLTLSAVLIVVLVGLVIATAGFFGAHAMASGWTGASAKIGRAQASSLYNFSYYGGSSVFGWLGGVFFVASGWSATVGMVAVLAVVASLLAIIALRSPRQVELPPRS